MNEPNMTREQLVQELSEMHRRIASVEASEAELRDTAEAMREEARRLRIALESAEAGTWSMDLVEGTRIWDDHCPELFGLPSGTFRESFHDWLYRVHPDDRDRVRSECVQSLEEIVDYDTEYRVIWPDGSVHALASKSKVFTDQHGRAVRMTGVCWDVTDRRQAQEELLREKRLSDEYINSLPGLFYVFDEQRFVRWNAELERVTGYSAEEISVRYGTDFFEGEDRDFIEAQMRKVFLEGVADAEAELVTKDGRRIPYYLTGMRKVFDGKEHLVGLGIDITDRIRARKALRESEEQLRAVADYTYDWESWLAPDGRLMWVNPAVERLTGYSVAECKKMADYPLPIVYEEDRKEFAAQLQQAVEERDSTNDIEFRISRKSGAVEWMAMSWQPIYDAQGEHIGQRTSARNVTDRKTAEEALRTSEEKYRVLFEQSADATLIIDDNKFVDCNEAVVEMLRYRSKEDLLSTHPSELSPKMQPDGRTSYEKADEMMDIAYEKGSHRFEWDHRRADGEVFPVEVLLTAIPVGEKKILHVVWRDITDRKRIEKEREELIEKLEAQNTELERFTYTVSHDLKSPLITIKGFVGMLSEDLAGMETKSVEKSLAHLSDAADKMARLLENLLELSRIGRLVNPPEDVPLEEVAKEAWELARGRDERGSVHIDISPELPVVYGDRVRLLEIIQNLFENAMKYMGDEPQPRIEVGYRRDGNESICYVRDNGIGIESQYHERVFGLFDQLDPKAEGSGIGLALVKRIIEAHGGRIWVESRGSGHGSTFCFTIPGREESSIQDVSRPNTGTSRDSR